MPSRTVEMLIKSGIIPKNAVQQLEHWKVLEEGTAETVGSQPVSLESDSEQARQFTEELRQQMEIDNQTIRETELAPVGETMDVWIVWEDLVANQYPVKATLDDF